MVTASWDGRPERGEALSADGVDVAFDVGVGLTVGSRLGVEDVPRTVSRKEPEPRIRGLTPTGDLLVQSAVRLHLDPLP
jgi:hypothetical protein